MNICEGIDILIYKNIKINQKIKDIINSASEKGYNIADINDLFYNDTCISYSSPNRTDITISERIKDIYNENFIIFSNYNGCAIVNFNVNGNIATVKCKSKVKTNFFEEKKEAHLIRIN